MGSNYKVPVYAVKSGLMDAQAGISEHSAMSEPKKKGHDGRTSDEIARLESAMKERGVKQADLMSALELRPQNFTNWKKAGRVPGDQLFEAARYLKVDPMQLRYGEAAANAVKEGVSASCDRDTLHAAIKIVMEFLEANDAEADPEIIASVTVKAYELLQTVPFPQAKREISQIIGRLH